MVNKNKKKIFFLGFILLGILFSYLFENPLFFIAIGATGKVIIGHYDLPPITSYGKVIAGHYYSDSWTEHGKVICGKTIRNQYNPNIIIG